MLIVAISLPFPSAGDNCSAFGEVLGADYDVPNITSWHNDVVQVTCSEGYQLEDGETEIEIRCNETQEWDPYIIECTGKVFNI